MPRIVEATPETILEAAELLRMGDVVAFATETVYGLGADTFNEMALDSIFRLKRRPSDNPLIAHVLDAGQALQLATDWDDRCERLADRFWPGPLTMVLSKRDSVPSRATAGYPSIAIRSPAHPVARQLLETFGGPISAPSANRSGHVSPTIAKHVADEFDDVPDLLILDGGTCKIGIESTVLDLTGSELRVLRPGSITAEQLRDELGAEIVEVDISAQAASPGTASAHYAPRTPLKLVRRENLCSAIEHAAAPVVVLVMDDIPCTLPYERLLMPRRPEAYAAGLYAALHKADLLNLATIIVEMPTDRGGLWDAVRNRLKRAEHQ